MTKKTAVRTIDGIEVEMGLLDSIALIVDSFTNQIDVRVTV